MRNDLILKFAKLVLVSSQKEDYELLKKIGFCHVMWFKTLEEAASFLNEKNIKEYDVFIERYKRGAYNQEISHLLWENRQKILRLEIYSNRYESKQDYVKTIYRKMHGVHVYATFTRKKLKEKYLCNYKRYTNISLEDFYWEILLFLQDKQISVSKEEISILYLTSLPKEQRIKIQSQLQEKGWNVTISDGTISNVSSYAIVFVDTSYFQDVAVKLENSLLASVTFEKESSLIGKKVIVEVGNKKLIYPIATDEKSYIIESLCHVTIDWLMKITNFHVLGDIKTTSFFEREYLEKKKEFLERQWEENEKFEKMISLLNLLYDRHAKKYIKDNPNGIKIRMDRENNLYTIDNYYNGILHGVIQIPMTNSEDVLKKFKVKTMTKKGRLTEFQEVGIHPEMSVLEKNVPNPPSAKEMAIYYNIQCKIYKMVEEALKKKEYEQSKSSRKRNKMLLLTNE